MFLNLYLMKSLKNFYQYTGKKIILTRIDSNTLNAWRNWVPINTRKPPNGGWFKVAHFQKNYQKYVFDIAIWDEN